MVRPLIGRRDTLVIFQERIRTQSAATGTWENGAWLEVCQELAEVQQVLPSRSESAGDGIVLSRRPCRIRCLYRDDITSEMRVLVHDRVLEIVSGPVELGRRDGLELMCQEMSTQGEAP